ncbi:MAG: S8 family serine peptidase, partial [Actinobacteria bacterium]|nr:S8 family serine peptidase [Actinomycetota bacterium]
MPLKQGSKSLFGHRSNSQVSRLNISTRKARFLATVGGAVALLIPLTPISAGAAPLLDLRGLVEDLLGAGEPDPVTTASSTANFVEGELIVRFDPSSNAPERAQARQRQGLQKVRDLPLEGLELVRIPGLRKAPDHARNVVSEKSVRYAEPNFIASTAQAPNDPYFSNLWGLDNNGQTILNVTGAHNADIDGPEAWDFGGASTPVVAVVDAGVDVNHADLTANIWTNPGESGALAANGIDDDRNGYIDDVHGWDFVNDDNTVVDSDEISHGTHVAGTIAAVRDNGVGVAGVSQAEIMSLKFLGPEGFGTLSGALYAIDYAVKNDADLSNHSWTTGGYSQSLADGSWPLTVTAPVMPSSVPPLETVRVSPEAVLPSSMRSSPSLPLMVRMAALAWTSIQSLPTSPLMV